MLHRRIICSGILVAMLQPVGMNCAQNDPRKPEPDETYRLHLPVDEVVLTFSVQDANGLPIRDLKAGDIRLWDNGAAPRRVVAFDELFNRPIRAGILLDTSESMQRELPANRSIAEKFARQIVQQQSDEAFVSEFGNTSDLVQPWTGDPALVVKGIEGTREKPNVSRGTALFNAVFQACSSSFREADPTATGNFILLFSDGEDNAGLTSNDEAARACQRSNTQVFALVPVSVERKVSTGPKALRELASKTGGRVFAMDDSEEADLKDLKSIASEMRNQYRLVYNPANFKHDGAFHEILVQPPDRVGKIEVRSGYFAPRQ